MRMYFCVILFFPLVFIYLDVKGCMYFTLTDSLILIQQQNVSFTRMFPLAADAQRVYQLPLR